MNAQQIQTEQCSAQCNLLTNLPLQAGNNIREMHPSDAPFLLRKRYWVSILFNIGMILFMILRANLSIALVEMTSDKTIQLNNQTIIQKAEFDWDTRMKGFILSVFSIGYIFGPLGGVLALKIGSTPTFGLGIAATAVLTMLTPFLIRMHLSIYIVARLLEGVFESFSTASGVAIFVLWALPHERARLSMVGGCGAYLGAAINYPLSGFFAYNYGWESVFYFAGGLTLIWSIIWLSFVPNDPTKDRLMTKKERDLFKRNISETFIKKKPVIPWKRIARSKPVWAYLNEYFSFYWAQSFLLYCLPLYIKDLYNVNIQNIGLISGIPLIAGFVGNLTASFIFDYIRNHSWFSKSTVEKSGFNLWRNTSTEYLFELNATKMDPQIPVLCLKITLIGFFYAKFTQTRYEYFQHHRIFIAIGQISFVIGLIYCGLWANFEQTIICLSLARLLAGTTEVSYQILVMEMFSEFAALLRGFSVTATSLAYFFNPIVMGFLVADHSRSSWNLYFLFLSFFNIWSLVIYYRYGSGQLQEWATSSTGTDVYKNKSDDVTKPDHELSAS